MGKRHKPEEIIGKLREAEIVLAQGGTTADASRRIAVTEQTYYRWRKEYGGLKTDQARTRDDNFSIYFSVFHPIALRSDQANGARRGLLFTPEKFDVIVQTGLVFCFAPCSCPGTKSTIRHIPESRVAAESRGITGLKMRLKPGLLSPCLRDRSG